MKRMLLAVINVFLLVFLSLISCKAENISNVKNETERKEYVEAIKTYMVEGAELSTERPSTELLSEEEIMILAAEYTVANGYLDPRHEIYKELPSLATAKVAEPMFVYYEPDLRAGSIKGYYRLYTVDNEDNACLEAFVFAEEQIVEKRRNPSFSMTYNDCGMPKHIVTKKECEQMGTFLFPGQELSEPIALSISTNAAPHKSTTWYFTVKDRGRSSQGSYIEYLLDINVFGAEPSSDISTNMRMMLDKRTVAGGWGTRLAKLDEPLYLHEKIAQAKTRSASELSVQLETKNISPVSVTPVEF